ncbi:hypothetical protein [Bremerella cremea]|uniref:hypothetical protein n=1 Tax=Bremerella cremea TaxID=1031537 RepID=UPI0031F1ADD8
MPRHWPTHGFRFSMTDALAIAICAAATIFALGLIGPLAWLMPFVLGHFFLFCNVFRIPRKPELVWAGGFVALVGLCLISGTNVLHAMWLVVPLTIGVLVYSIRLPSYHGIGTGRRGRDPERPAPDQLHGRE